MSRRGALAEINHRLAVVESLATPVGLIEVMNDRLVVLAGLQGNVIDLRVLAANVQRVADTVAIRLVDTVQMIEQAVDQIVVQSRNG